MKFYIYSYLQRDRHVHVLNVSVVVISSLLMKTMALGMHHFNIRLHSTSINCYAQRPQAPSLIEDFWNIWILTDVWGFIILFMEKCGSSDWKLY